MLESDLLPLAAAITLFVVVVLTKTLLSYRRKKRQAKAAWPDDIEYR